MIRAGTLAGRWEALTLKSKMRNPFPCTLTHFLLAALIMYMLFYPDANTRFQTRTRAQLLLQQRAEHSHIKHYFYHSVHSFLRLVSGV